MRRIIAVLIGCLAAGCGSGGGVAELVGPILELGEVEELRIDQLYVGSVKKDEFGAPRFAVYLRDAATQQVIACAGSADGLRIVQGFEIFYAGLDVPLQPLKELASYQGMEFQLVVVEKDGDDCPARILSDDDIVGATGTLSFDGLLNVPLVTTNGQARVTLRARGTEAHSVPLMVPTLTAQLGVEYLRIPDAVGAEETPIYSLVLVGRDGDGFGCQIGGVEMPVVRAGPAIYGGLNLFFPCGGIATADALARPVQVQLWRQSGDTTDQLTQTAFHPMGELVGQTIPFENDQATIRFRDFNAAAFQRDKVSQEEIGRVALASLSLTAPATPGIPQEVHLLDGAAGYSIACIGAGQGPGFVPTEGQGDLFGWPAVTVAVVERSGGGACPGPLGDGDTVVAATAALGPEKIAGGTYPLRLVDGRSAGSTALQQR